LDEPTNGLDPQGIADIRNLIQYLSKQEGKTILVSSHLLSEMEQVATQILIINKGKKIAMGPTSTLLDPNKAIVQIQTTDNLAAKKFLANSVFSKYELARPNGIYLSLSTSEIPALHKALVQANIPVMSLEIKKSLEDYFLEITASNN
jgi:ABC-type multidrug transport system ATPase subunit